MKRQRGDALVEFALAWPVLFLAVAGSVQMAIWSAESFAAGSAAQVAARSALAPGADAAKAGTRGAALLRPWVFGAVPVTWCPGGPNPAPELWVCGRGDAKTVEVRVGGSVPAVIVPWRGARLPLNADVRLGREQFS